MSNREKPDHKLLCELHDFKGRYDMARGQLSADELLALWSELWRFSENVIVDHRQLKADERRRRRRR